MRVDDFDFDLPSERIAQHPVAPRHAARLLHLPATGHPQHKQVSDLADLLRPGDVLVVNDTRVIASRLIGRRGEGRIEATLHRPIAPGQWRAFVRPARRFHVGETVCFADALEAQVTARGEGGEVTLDFHCSDDQLLAALARYGVMPLPPYIKRQQPETRDHQDYQTLFAARDGAVAAPTASLHFTPQVLNALAARGVSRAVLTLHVGAGTFLPVKVDRVADHKMHGEWGEISPATADAINAARAAGGRVVAAGTTALRLLESATDETGHLHPFCGETEIFITPGYRFRLVDLLLTNFHLPRSTLFMLVCAFAGRQTMLATYAEAMAQGYRFYSYGDASLLHRRECAP